MSEGGATGTPHWIDILDEARIPADAVAPVSVSGWPVVVVRIGSRLHALGGICTHDQSPLGGARIRGGALVCPRHQACFDPVSGACVNGFTLPPLPRYPVRVRDGRVEVDAAAVARDPPVATARARWDLTKKGTC